MNSFLKFYQSIFFTDKVALTPDPNVTPTANNADKAISITLPAAKVTIVLPLYIELVPTDNALEITVLGIFVPFTLTACVNVVPRATETLLK